MQGNTAKTVGVGLLGGLAGLLAMGYTMKATKRFVRRPNPLTPRDKRSMSLIGSHHEKDEPATEALARTVYGSIRGQAPSERQKQALGQVVHAGFGLAMGALYCGLQNGRGNATSDLMKGALFGGALWALGDELLVPLLGLADKPTQYSVSSHAHTLLGHLAYGAATGAVVGGALRANGDTVVSALRSNGGRVVGALRSNGVVSRLASAR